MYFTVFTWKGGPPASKEMNVVADLLLKKAFSDYEVVSGWKGTDIHVVNLRLNPDADVFSFLRNQPVQIVAGTAASVTISGLSAVGLVKDLWNAYRNNQVDLKLRLHVSDLKGRAARHRNCFVCSLWPDFASVPLSFAVTIRPSMDSTFVPNRRMLAEAIAKKMREVDRAISALATTAKVQWAVDDDDEESTTSRILEAAIQNLRVSSVATPVVFSYATTSVAPQVTIDRLHFRYEDDTTDSSQPLVLGVVVDSLQFFPCAGVCCCGVTASGAGAASSAEPARFRHHFVTWDGLAVYLNPGVSADVDVAPTIVAMATPTLPTASPAAPAPVRTHWTGLDMSRVQVLVAPSSGRVCLTQHGGRVTHSSCPAGTQVCCQSSLRLLNPVQTVLRVYYTISDVFPLKTGSLHVSMSPQTLCVCLRDMFQLPRFEHPSLTEWFCRYLCT